MDNIVEILLCEGGDIEIGARISKHILVFAFDPLSLTLSYIVPCIISYCSFILICLVLLVCAHSCVQPRDLQIAPQLLFREIRGDSSEPFTGNSATLFGYTKCVTIYF